MTSSKSLPPTARSIKDSLVFVVEDSPLNQKILQDILGTLECRIETETDGTQAIEKLKKKSPDIILLDIMLPGINGLNICRFIKGEDRLKHIPVIFLTGQTEPEDVITGFEAGAVDYVTKPFMGPELIARVKTHLELKIARDFEKQLFEELTKNMKKINQLSGLLPICANCKKIRDSKGYWQKVERYISEHSNADFSHSLCPDCIKKLYPEDSPEPKTQSPKLE